VAAVSVAGPDTQAEESIDTPRVDTAQADASDAPATSADGAAVEDQSESGSEESGSDGPSVPKDKRRGGKARGKGKEAAAQAGPAESDADRVREVNLFAGASLVLVLACYVARWNSCWAHSDVH
jgi:hypothetical protein